MTHAHTCKLDKKKDLYLFGSTSQDDKGKKKSNSKFVQPRIEGWILSLKSSGF